MRDDSEVYVGLDTSKLKISVAVAAAGRDGEVRLEMVPIRRTV